MATTTELQRLASAVHALRPDWRSDSLLTFLSRHFPDRAFNDLAVAAVVVALDPKTTTPELLKSNGAWWSAAYVASGQPTLTAGPGSEAACPKDGHEHEPARCCRWCRSEAIAAPDEPRAVAVGDAEKEEAR